jgi:catechol 2,3-dioxygenase-like lactoylglutathione lyase family enzyme
MMAIQGLDHVALPTANPVAMMEFYQALGFVVPDELLWRDVRHPCLAIQCGQQEINLHEPAEWQDPAFTLRGPTAQPGCGDFCFVWDGRFDELYAVLDRAGAANFTGHVRRIGARGYGMSIYTRDPDNNLLEFIVYKSQVE